LLAGPCGVGTHLHEDGIFPDTLIYETNGKFNLSTNTLTVLNNLVVSKE